MAIQINADTITSREAIDLFNEILGRPIDAQFFYNLVSRGVIAAVNPEEKPKRFRREDVIRLIQEKKELERLLTSKQALERIRDGGVPSLQYHEFIRAVQSGRLPKAREAEGQFYFNPKDVDAIIPKLREEEEERKKGAGLLSSREAVEWINQKLWEMEREETVQMDTFYHWVIDEKIPYDRKIPGKNGVFQMYCFSEESLLQAPIFKAPPLMPEDKGNEVVEVTSTKQLQQLENEWGELVTKKGVREQSLSPGAVSKKNRKVRPVANVGNNLLFPKDYIPEKRRRRLKEVIEL